MAINRRKQNLKKMLEQYSARELEFYEKEYEKMPLHSFSQEYRKKMRDLREQPIQQKKHTFVYRMAMVCVCTILGLVIVNQASAYVFGITLWDKLMESAPKEMVTTVYQGKDNGRNRKGGEGTAGKERVHDIPTEIPEGYELVSEKSSEKTVSAKWRFGDNGQLICFSYEINQDLHMYDNREWETEEAVVIGRYQGKIYTRSAYSYLLWDDEEYHNSITIVNINMSKKELLTIAESLYKK